MLEVSNVFKTLFSVKHIGFPLLRWYQFITTLFSLFGPFFTYFSIKNAVIRLTVLGLITWIIISLSYFNIIRTVWISFVSQRLFPNSFSSGILLSIFISLGLINLISLMIYSYPITTTLGFNLSAALSCFLGGLFIQLLKFKYIKALLPTDSPWYLLPFLCLVELVRIIVRPITLSFRLLANIVAGHVLILLICKMEFLFMIGIPFWLLELIVSLVQGFVFSILIRVYLQEAYTH